MSKSRAVSAKGVIEYRPHLAKGLQVGSIINCADNTGARSLRIVNVVGYKGRIRRVPSASVGDRVLISVRKGNPTLRKQVLPAIIVRQRQQFRRANGMWIQFEDNAAVIITPEGELRGSEVRGPVAKEAAERWPRIAGNASIIL
jgi:large subunit ribosomal protein L14